MEQICPSCGYHLERQTCISKGVEAEKQPQPGDVSICFGCCQTLKYGPGLALEAIDLDSLPDDVKTDIRRAIFAIRATKIARGR